MFIISNAKRFVPSKVKCSAFNFIAPAVQLITSIGLIIFMLISGILPDKYILIISAILFIALAITTLVQFANQKFTRIMGIIVSCIISIGASFGIYALYTANDVFNKISSDIHYEVSNMVVLVNKDDSATDLYSAKDYNFAVQNFTDTENNDLMIAEMQKELGLTVNVTTYDNMLSLANALVDGTIDAAICNDAFIGLLEEDLPNFSTDTKVIYQFGIEVEVPKKETNTDDEQKEDPLAHLSISEKPFAVYISGIDVSGSINYKSRSDVNIIMCVNPTTKEILLVTTPRDYYVVFANASNGQYDKLTHAGLYGVSESMETLENLYDVDLSYYARVNFTSVERIVDALGGIDVNSDYAFTALNTYYFNQGMNYDLSGAEALAFARERHYFGDGDNQRGKNQQAVIEGVLNKAMSPAMLTGINGIIDSISSNIQTNMGANEISELVKMQLNDMSSWSFTSVAAQGISASRPCYTLGQNASVMLPVDESVEEISQLMNDFMTVS